MGEYSMVGMIESMKMLLTKERVSKKEAKKTCMSGNGWMRKCREAAPSSFKNIKKLATLN